VSACHSWLQRLALVSLAATLVVATAALLDPFENAAWLVAYLFLVGFTAQVLLARGQDALARNSRPVETPAQILLWNAGVVAVPAGVFANMRILVALGGAALLGALVGFWRRTDPLGAPRAESPRLPVAYVALIVVMGISSLIGIALAWDRPWI
jgi:hypothetical protein